MVSIRAVTGHLLVATFVPALAFAQGFGIYEQSACMQARAVAGVAEPCDDNSAVAVNPAGLTGAKGFGISGGDIFVHGSDTFTSDAGKATDAFGVKGFPFHVYARYGVNEKLAIGFGAYVPYGLAIKWPLDFPGRFVSYDGSLTTVYLQPTVSYAVTPQFSIGGGPVIAVGSVDLNRREDLARVPLGTLPATFGIFVPDGTDFENTSLSASGAKGYGANVGVMVKAGNRVRFGARYLTHVKLDYDGNATFTPVGQGFTITKPNPLGLPVGTPIDPLVQQVRLALPNQPASTSIDMPAQFVVGTSVHVTDPLTLFVDYHWVGWSSFDTITLEFSNAATPDEPLPQNYHDTSTIRIGAEYAATPTLRLRGGFAVNQAAAPDETVTPLLPDASRQHLTAGAGFTLAPNLTLDVAYQFVRYDDRRGRVVDAPTGQAPTVALNSGVYRSRADLLGITFTYHMKR